MQWYLLISIYLCFIISFYHSPYNNVINVLPKKKSNKKPN